MRSTTHNGRTNKHGQTFKANHNDRTFDTTKAQHITPNKEFPNIVIKCLADTSNEQTLEEYEKGFYERTFTASQNAKNQRYINQRHPEKVKDVSEVYKSKRTCPEESILQVGKKGDSIPPKEFENIVRDYVSEFNSRFGEHCLILDVALHFDETSPHAHLRRCWLSKDKDNNTIENEAAALRDMGIERPDLTKPKSRYNNAKQSFSELDRALFNNICINHGFTIETTPETGKKAKELADYKLQAVNEEINSTQQLLQEQCELLSSTTKATNQEEKKLNKIIELKNSIIEQLKNLDKFRLLSDIALWLFRHDRAYFERIQHSIKAEMTLKQDLSNIEHSFEEEITR